jgi:hypothetical protein
MIDYCKILEINYEFTEKELKSAYHKLSKKYHPDTNNGSNEFIEKFRLINDAYEKLLILTKSGKYEKWKFSNQKNNYNSKERNKTKDNSNNQKQSNTNETHSKNNSNRFEKNTDLEKFSLYEFVNNQGLFEEDLIEINEKSFSIQKQHILNDIIEVGSFSYRVTNFVFLKEIGNVNINTKSDGYFLIVDFDIKNISKSMISIHNYMFRLFDKDGYFYEFSNEGLSKMYLLQERIIPFFGKELNPRINGNYRLIFEVPEIGDYYLQLCGGKYSWDSNNLCICEEIEIIKLKTQVYKDFKPMTKEVEKETTKLPVSFWHKLRNFWK